MLLKPFKHISSIKQRKEEEAKNRAKHEEEERLRKEYIDTLESKNTELVRRLKDRINATKFKQVSTELMKRLSTFLQQHQFVVPGTTEPNFAVIKRDMAKLKKGISQIVDDIIKENEPPEEEPSPPKRGRQSSREPRSPPTPPTKSTPMRTKATLRAQTVAPSSSGPLPASSREPRSPSTPPPKSTPIRTKTTLRAQTVEPASSSSGPLPAKTQLTGSVPPPKSQFRNSGAVIGRVVADDVPHTGVKEHGVRSNGGC